ncbi:GGDEF domain-containing protein [Hydrogenimonas urashimensis]|uniref:GGDEF domain-containing protein n=1 Tax=Hydrogenimonas urashimensis TaxID=2740515 RepID=UPI0019167D9D|nr:diguanylate cyclase [Hydrogenimonas urashimensis]
MADIANSGRYKILGALLGGIVLTSAAIWLPVLEKEMEAYGLARIMGVNTAYALFFLIAFVVSYVFIKEWIRAKVQIQRCDEVLNPSSAFELHDKQLFFRMGHKEILMARRNEWPVSMIAMYVGAGKGRRRVSQEMGKKIKEIVVKELDSLLRGSDLAGSFSKNEYLLLLPDCSLEHAKEIAERIGSHLSRKEIDIEEEKYTLGCQCGLASLEPVAADLKRLMERSLNALDRIRGKSGNLIETY